MGARFGSAAPKSCEESVGSMAADPVHRRCRAAGQRERGTSTRGGEPERRRRGHALRNLFVCNPQPPERGFDMLYWAAVFFIIALVSAVLGFGGIAAGAAGIAKILFFVFLVLGALSLIFGRRVPA
jgi:uncharacterized membrane protein YtjA (UPF0391 family)